MKNHLFLICFAMAFSFWLLSFVIRIFFVDIPEINTTPIGNQGNNQPSIINEITQLLSENNNKNAFYVIFKNNIKGCILNIVGGVMLGLGTLINLMYNGFFSADIFANSYNAGISVESILKVTLPHSFELIGFWLSGAIGFYIAWNMIQFMRGKDVLNLHFYKKVGFYSLITFFVILAAAYVEIYISTTIKI